MFGQVRPCSSQTAVALWVGLGVAMAKLTALKVSRLTQPGMYGDGAGLYLQVAKGGSRSWAFRYRLKGKDRQMGLGPYPAVSLADARKRAIDAKRCVIDGFDPIDQRKAERQANFAKPSFAECAERYIEAHRAGWQNAKHAAQWASTLRTYTNPIIGTLPVDQVETRHVLEALQPIWATKTETASRIRGRVENVLDWAKVQGYRTGENPARWRGHLDKLLPARSKVTTVRHHNALPYADMPNFMADLRSRQGMAARALEFAVLTAARSGEVRQADWSEFDLQTRVWTVPAGRMKARREHRVPLSNGVIKILDDLASVSETGVVFPGKRQGMPLSDMSLTAVLRRMGLGGPTVHGFRSSFRDWAGECTSFQREVAEAALAHMVGDKVEAAYRRGDALEKRRKLMDAWNAYCDGASAKSNVIAMPA